MIQKKVKKKEIFIPKLKTDKIISKENQRINPIYDEIAGNEKFNEEKYSIKAIQKKVESKFRNIFDDNKIYFNQLTSILTHFYS